MRILITGANGFIGSALTKYLLNKKDVEVIIAGRRIPNHLAGDYNFFKIDSIDHSTNWLPALIDVDVVIHCAGRAHVLHETEVNPLHEFRKINVHATLQLVRQATESKVKRFIFLSSIGVNGNLSITPFLESQIAKPKEFYAISKYEAELELIQYLRDQPLEYVIIRPPLVYGPNAPGNFGRLIQAVAKGASLPLGAIHNQRSLVALDNLVDLIVTCIDHPAAANQIFLAGDGEDLSTTELLQKMAKALGVSSRLIPIPMWCLQFGARLLGKQAMAQRLCGSLQVDISKAKNVLGWTPPLTVDEALQKTADDFLKRNA